MNRLQKLVTSLLPASLASAAEAASRAVQTQCRRCGNVSTIWELGGIRWGTNLRRHMVIRCPQCQRYRWHNLHKNRDSMKR